MRTRRVAPPSPRSRSSATSISTSCTRCRSRRVAEAEADVAEALAFSPPHLSFYHLTLEPNTLFHRYPPPLPDDETAADIEEAVQAKLGAAGYQHYETSAYARPGRQCRHNLNYWRFGDYLGIGAGAHSKLSFADRIVRQVRYKQPNQYLEQIASGRPVLEEGEVTRADVGFEFMLNALRLAEGVPAALFAERTGFPLAIVQKELARRRGTGTDRARSRGDSSHGARPAVPQRSSAALSAIVMASAKIGRGAP